MEDKGIVQCRNCSGEHRISKCPQEDTILAGGKVPDDKNPPVGPCGASGSAIAELDKAPGSKCLPLNIRESGNRRGNAMQSQRRDYPTAIRISNLSERTTEADLEDLVKPFGPLKKRYLAKDRTTNLCKGFAYVHFKSKSVAARAISHLNGHSYDHLTLSVDWSSPPGQQNVMVNG